MKVVFCSSEVFPFAKTGGLADVCGALSEALTKEDCQVKVFMPLYKGIKPETMYEDYGISHLGKAEIIFIRHDKYFLRDNLYGSPQGDYPDNLERFSFFSRKTIELIERFGFAPDVVHCHDWQASLVIAYLKLLHRDNALFKNTKSILTIHNLAYQGLMPAKKYSLLGIPSEYFSMNYFEFYGKINLLKGGIVFSDMTNTVSPTYARQIQTAEYGCGLEGVLQGKGDRLSGILNAIDYGVWSPKTDKLIYKQYSPSSLRDKYVNKKKFQKDLGFKVSDDAFLLGMVTRLAEQKGVDILCEGIEKMLKENQLVILGFGDEKYHKLLGKKAKKFKDRFALHLKFDEGLAHKIYASCDAFLMPSRFEPCGLSQLISYKYATIPIVHHTGGLVDTVGDVKDQGGGFVSSRYSGKDFSQTVARAHRAFSDKKAWKALMKKVTGYNFSWKSTAKHYIEMYEKIKKLPTVDVSS